LTLQSTGLFKAIMELEFAITTPHSAKLEAFHACHARLELVSPEVAYIV
jgi:hypothetical protein